MPNIFFAMPRASLLAVVVAMALLPALPARALDTGRGPQASGPSLPGGDPTTTFGTIRVRGPQPTSLPTRIPTTM